MHPPADGDGTGSFEDSEEEEENFDVESCEDPDGLDGMSTSEADAAGWNAKSKTNEKRKARGLVKKKPEGGSNSRTANSDQDPRKANNVCASCGEIGQR